jgi:hypothetical protein
MKKGVSDMRQKKEKRKKKDKKQVEKGSSEKIVVKGMEPWRKVFGRVRISGIREKTLEWQKIEKVAVERVEEEEQKLESWRGQGRKEEKGEAKRRVEGATKALKTLRQTHRERLGKETMKVMTEVMEEGRGEQEIPGWKVALEEVKEGIARRARESGNVRRRKRLEMSIWERVAKRVEGRDWRKGSQGRSRR